MTTPAINRDSFIEDYKASTPGASLPVSFGTVEVTLGHITKRIPAKKYDEADTLSGYIFIVSGIVARYRTGSKIWSVNMYNLVREGKEIEFAHYGRDDRSSKFRKAIVGFSA